MSKLPDRLDPAGRVDLWQQPVHVVVVTEFVIEEPLAGSGRVAA